VQSAQVTLTSQTTTSYGHPDIKDSYNKTTTHFDFWQEDIITNLFNKFLSWSDIAATNHAEKFLKAIAIRPINQWAGDNVKQSKGEDCTYYFHWDDSEATLSPDDSFPYGAGFTTNDIIHFQYLLNKLPSMKEKLATAIRNKDAQKDLFK
jgi:hypothetical protein